MHHAHSLPRTARSQRRHREHSAHIVFCVSDGRLAAACDAMQRTAAHTAASAVPTTRALHSSQATPTPPEGQSVDRQSRIFPQKNKCQPRPAHRASVGLRGGAPVRSHPHHATARRHPGRGGSHRAVPGPARRARERRRDKGQYSNKDLLQQTAGINDQPASPCFREGHVLQARRARP